MRPARKPDIPPSAIAAQIGRFSATPRLPQQIDYPQAQKQIALKHAFRNMRPLRKPQCLFNLVQLKLMPVRGGRHATPFRILVDHSN
jgi:hypothetical protein